MTFLEIVESFTLTGRQILDILHIIFNTTFTGVLIFASILSLIFLTITIWSFFIKDKLYNLKLTKTPMVTVQIPTYNELAALNCARKCLEFDYPKDQFEIIIGDDSNDPNISAQLQAFADKHEQVSVRKRKTNEGFKPGNLNNMLKYTKGEYIVIFDSDHLPPKDFLAKLIPHLVQDTNLGAVQARWKIANADQNMISVLAACISDSFHRVILPVITTFSPSITLCGSAEIVRKDLLVQLGGWTSGALTEDVEYSFRMLQAGKHVKYVPEVEVECEVPQTILDLFKQQMRWAYGVISAFTQHGKNLFKIPAKQKIMTALFGAGYVMTGTIMLLMIFGVLSVLTHPPQPIDWGRFFYETARNFVITSGLLATSFGGAFAVKSGAMRIAKLVVASFTIGIVLIFYVNKGIYKSLTGQPMQWFILKKNGNKTIKT